ncbi:phage protein [Xenorhabdus budapestensis]|uniref:Phage protein n=1 Tax=Xenorhabdus budapestensis TaxID=290110 RepID=A0A2D0J3J1_XENBU|nr:phage protein [Xenorhabdus budapestensis]
MKVQIIMPSITSLMSGAEITNQIKGLMLPPGYRMVRVDRRLSDWISQSHFELALVNDASKEVAYYNRVVIQSDVVLNCRPVTQILVWRIRTPQHRAVLRDLAGKVFLIISLNDIMSLYQI